MSEILRPQISEPFKWRWGCCLAAIDMYSPTADKAGSFLKDRIHHEVVFYYCQREPSGICPFWYLPLSMPVAKKWPRQVGHVFTDADFGNVGSSLRFRSENSFWMDCMRGGFWSANYQIFHDTPCAVIRQANKTDFSILTIFPKASENVEKIVFRSAGSFGKVNKPALFWPKCGKGRLR